MECLDDVTLSTTRERGHFFVQNLVNKYNGSGGPYDHVVAFRQAIHGEQVRYTHIEIQNLG